MKKIFLLSFMSLLAVSCNSDGFKTGDEDAISGEVSSNRIINQLIPISSAYADDQAICTPSEGENNRKVQVYLVDKSGNEVKICETHLNSNKKYSYKIRKNLIPEGHFIAIKAELPDGNVREAISSVSNLNGLKASPESTVAAPIVKEMMLDGQKVSQSLIQTKVNDFISSSLGGVKASEFSPMKIAAMKAMLQASKSAIISQVLSEKSGALAASKNPALKNFVSNSYNSNYKVSSDGSVQSGLQRLTYK